MIGLNQIVQSPSATDEMLGSRRRRTPSQYAQSIRELTKVNSRSQARIKSIDFVDQQSYLTNQSGSDKSTALTYILPGKNKKLKLHVIIKKQPKSKSRKQVTTLPVDKAVLREAPKNQNLLDVLFKLCEQQKLQQQVKDNQPPLPSSGELSQNRDTSSKQRKLRKGKQEQQKYLKMYQKYQSLNQKLQEMENDTFIL